MHTATVAVVVAMILTVPVLVCCYAYSGEIDAVAVVVGVHDGDTFYLDRIVNGSDTVRLADIDAAELGQPLSYVARDFLKGLVLSKTVYLDVDDVYTYDYYGTGDRLVCVVYVEHNSTHYENVNKALWAEGLAEKKEYDNEFSADTWTRYVSKVDVIPEFPPSLILLIFMVLITAVATFSTRYLRDVVPPIALRRSTLQNSEMQRI